MSKVNEDLTTINQKENCIITRGVHLIFFSFYFHLISFIQACQPDICSQAKLDVIWRSSPAVVVKSSAFSGIIAKS